MRWRYTGLADGSTLTPPDETHCGRALGKLGHVVESLRGVAVFAIVVWNCWVVHEVVNRMLRWCCGVIGGRPMLDERVSSAIPDQIARILTSLFVHALERRRCRSRGVACCGRHAGGWCLPATAEASAARHDGFESRKVGECDEGTREEEEKKKRRLKCCGAGCTDHSSHSLKRSKPSLNVGYVVRGACERMCCCFRRSLSRWPGGAADAVQHAVLTIKCCAESLSRQWQKQQSVSSYRVVDGPDGLTRWKMVRAALIRRPW